MNGMRNKGDDHKYDGRAPVVNLAEDEILEGFRIKISVSASTLKEFGGRIDGVHRLILRLIGTPQRREWIVFDVKQRCYHKSRCSPTHST